jgi:predicted nucleic acid-binding protein
VVIGADLERAAGASSDLPTLLVAAPAEISRRTVVRVDADFERIAHDTGQSIQRLTIPDSRGV